MTDYSVVGIFNIVSQKRDLMTHGWKWLFLHFCFTDDWFRAWEVERDLA